MAGPLVAGANAPLSETVVGITARATHGGSSDFALAVLPLGGVDEAWLCYRDQPPAYGSGGELDISIDLSRLSAGVDIVSLALYSVGDRRMLSGLRDVHVVVGGHDIALANADIDVSSIVFAELYRRDGHWKIRSKRDGVFDGIEELGKRLGIAIIDRHRHTPGSPGGSDGPSQSPGRTGGLPNWTGSGFMVADRYIVTNAHVVDEATEIVVSGFTGRTTGHPVIVDRSNDIALVRLADSFGPSRITFRDAGVHLGEQAHAIGYPLATILGRGPQFTAGSVSNLLGPGDDARFMQITCPIQPGSSGGPVFDDAGNLIAVVTATLRDAQNVNFAVRASLVLPLLDAANIPFTRREKSQPITVSDIVRANSPFVWRVECRG